MTSVLEPSLAVRVPEPSPAAVVPKPSPAASAVIVEEVVELAMGWYIDFPSIGIVDVDAPKLPSNDREMLEVATERMFSEPSILEMIASVLRALHQYKRASSFAPPAASEAAEAIPEKSATGTESVAVMSAPPLISEGQKASLPPTTEVA
jgi:hypothetical protein